MQHRWNYEDDDAEPFFEGGEDAEQYISEEEYQELIGKASELQEAQLELAAVDLNQRLLAETISLMKGTWGWSFKSTKTKLKEIGMAFKFFQKITDTKDPMKKK
jgi:hypothetical protein